MTSDLPWTRRINLNLKGQKYPITGIPGSPAVQAVHVQSEGVKNQSKERLSGNGCTGWSILYTLFRYLWGSNLYSFRSLTSPFLDTRLSKIGNALNDLRLVLSHEAQILVYFALRPGCQKQENSETNSEMHQMTSKCPILKLINCQNHPVHTSYLPSRPKFYPFSRYKVV